MRQAKALERRFDKILELLSPTYASNQDMKDAPRRLAEMYIDFFRNDDPKRHFKHSFETNLKSMVVSKHIEVIGLCPRRLLPVSYVINIAYIPNGKTVESPRLNLAAIDLASFPKLQGDYTEELATLITDGLETKGVMVIVNGMYACHRSQKATTLVTTATRGEFDVSESLRKEFLDVLNLK